MTPSDCLVLPGKQSKAWRYCIYYLTRQRKHANNQTWEWKQQQKNCTVVFDPKFCKTLKSTKWIGCNMPSVHSLGYVLADDPQGETPLIPSEVMEFSIKHSTEVDINTTLQILGSPGEKASSIPGCNRTDSVIRYCWVESKVDIKLLIIFFYRPHV